MVRDITEPKYRFKWVENAATPEGVVEKFICTCGHTLVDDEDDGEYVTTHGCGRWEDEYLECDECGTKWEAIWRGMEFESQ